MSFSSTLNINWIHGSFIDTNLIHNFYINYIKLSSSYSSLRNLILRNLCKKIMYQVGINKGIILRCTAYQISRFALQNKQNRYSITRKRKLILNNLYKKMVYQVGINKGIILRWTAYQISRFTLQNKQNKYSITRKRKLILCNLYKKIVYQVGINKGIILRCTAYQISRQNIEVWAQHIILEIYNFILYYLTY